MEFQSLLTLFGLLAAAYAILPAERRLDLRLRLHKLDWILVSISFLVVHVLALSDVIKGLGLDYTFGQWKWGFDGKNVSYLLILGTAILLFIRIRQAKLVPGKLSILKELVEKLLFEKSYSSLVYLLEQHYKALFRINSRNYRVNRFARFIEPPDASALFFFGDSEPEPAWLRSVPISVRFRISKLLPSGNGDSEIASELLKRALLSEEFFDYLAKSRPYLTLQILNEKFTWKTDLLDIYVNKLLVDRNSVFYFEIRGNDNWHPESRYRYQLYEHNRLLHFLLSDANVAKKLAIWKPIREYTLSYLDNLLPEGENDPHNMPLGNFYPEGRWRSPIFATIQFFDIMVCEALFQGIKWHMWLYYLTYFAERIARNIRPNSQVELLGEWPTPYHYLLYEIVNRLCRWIEMAEAVPPEQENISMVSKGIDLENGNIPKSAILALGRVMRTVFESTELTSGYKNNLFESALRIYIGVKENKKTEIFAEVMRKSVLSGGMDHQWSGRADYLIQINEAFNAADHVLQMDARDWLEAIDDEQSNLKR